MSIYLPPVSVRIRQASSDSHLASLQKALTRRIRTLTPAIASSVVVVLNSLSRSKMRETLRLKPEPLLELLLMAKELSLLPVSNYYPYVRPVCFFCDGAVARDRNGAITEIIFVDSSRFYTSAL